MTNHIVAIVAGLIAAAAVILAVFLAVLRHDGGQPADEPEHQGADETYAAELHDDNDRQRRRLADDWPEQLTPPDMPELGEPALVRPYVAEYVGHHHDDTIDLRLVSPDWMPPVGAARNALVSADTQQMEPLR
jgi:hypothetical protein